MLSIKFFFYNKMKNIDNLEKISEKYKIEDAYIFINSIDSNKNNIILNDDTNNKKIYGKYVEFFEKDLLNIIMRINKIFEKDYFKNNTIKYKKINGILKKYHYLNKVLEYTPKNFFYVKYRLLKVTCYLEKKSLLVNLII